MLTIVSSVWLRPSKQIRAPLFSTKQKRQRQWIVVKYSIIYLVIVAGLAALIALRKSPHAYPSIAWMLTAFAAALFRDRLKLNCSVCRNI